MSKTTTGIIPTEYNVLVLPKEVEKVTPGGIHLPDGVHEKEEFATSEGELINASPIAFNFDDWPAEARKPVVGDTVLFTRYAGSVVTGSDGVKYRLVKDRDISAIKE